MIERRPEGGTLLTIAVKREAEPAPA
jgi:hypothetical protein